MMTLAASLLLFRRADGRSVAPDARAAPRDAPDIARRRAETIDAPHPTNSDLAARLDGLELFLKAALVPRPPSTEAAGTRASDVVQSPLAPSSDTRDMATKPSRELDPDLSRDDPPVAFDLTPVLEDYRAVHAVYSSRWEAFVNKYSVEGAAVGGGVYRLIASPNDSELWVVHYHGGLLLFPGASALKGWDSLYRVQLKMNARRVFAAAFTLDAGARMFDVYPAVVSQAGSVLTIESKGVIRGFDS